MMMSKLNIEAFVNFTTEENTLETQVIKADTRLSNFFKKPGNWLVSGMIQNLVKGIGNHSVNQEGFS